VADHLTEEEQVEALKRWWNENWLHVVLPIVLVLAGYFGWNSWQNHQQAQAAAASNLYQNLTTEAQLPPGESFSPDQKTKIAELANQLIENHPGTLYADMANLLLARIHVQDKQFDQAVTRLQAVAEGGENESIRELAKARWARVLNAKGEGEQALNLLASTPDDAYKSLYEEIRGDIYLSSGEKKAAHTAYLAALESLPPSEFNRRSLIELKMNAVAQPTPEPLPESMDATTDESPATDEAQGAGEDQA